MLVRVGRGLCGGRRLRRLSESVTESQLLARLRTRASELRLRCVPALAWCREIGVPTIVGVMRPVILLPASLATELSTAQLEALIAHELGHIRRWDPVVNLVQRLIEAILFFHPAMWWLSRRLRFERENCTDDLVVGLGFNPLDYARTLVEVAERALATQDREHLAACGVQAVDDPSVLSRRVHRLLAGREQKSLRLRGPRLAIVGLLIVSGLATAGLVIPSEEAGESNPDDGTRLGEEVAVLDTDESEAAQPEPEQALLPPVPDSGTTREDFAQLVADWIDQRLPFQRTVMQEQARTEFYQLIVKYAPEKPSAEWCRALLAALEKTVDREWPDRPPVLDPETRDSYYVNSPPKIRQLEWRLFLAVRRRPLDDENRARLDAQLDWIRTYIRALPKLEREDAFNTHEKRLAEFQGQIDDLLFPYFHEPLPDDRFEWLKQRMNGRKEKPNELLFVTSHVVSDWMRGLYDHHSERIPTPDIPTFNEPARGFGQVNGIPYANFNSARQFAGMRNTLDDFRHGTVVEVRGKLPGMISVIPRAVAARGLADVEVWFANQERGCLILDKTERQLVGVRGARLLPLDAKWWTEVDQIPTRLLERMLQKHGKRHWRIPEPVVVTQPFKNEMLLEMVALLVPDGRVFVVKVTELHEHMGLKFRIRPHNTEPIPGSPVCEAEAQLALHDVGEGRVGRNLKRELLARVHDPDLERQARQFVDRLRQGDGSAADWMAEEMDPRVRRLHAWWNQVGAHEPIRWYAELREQIAAGELRDGEGGYYRMKLWPDFEFNVVSTGDRAYFRVLAMDPENRQWSRTFLLTNDDGWKIVGTSNGRSVDEDFLRDSPAHDPAWGESVDAVAKEDEIASGRFLDLDTGTLMTAPTGGATKDWIRGNGFDLKFGSPNTNPNTRVKVNDPYKMAEGTKWAAELYDLSQSETTGRFGWITPTVARQLVEKTDPADALFDGSTLFQTREGKIGVLKVVGSHSYIHLRYKWLDAERAEEPGGVAANPKPEPPTQLDWQRRADGIEYRVRQAEPTWRIGELPLVYVDVRNSGDDRYLGVNPSRKTQAVILEHGEYAWSGAGYASTVPIRDVVTIPFVLNAHWIRHKRALMLESGRHPIRFRVDVHRVSLPEPGGSHAGPPYDPNTQPEPIKTLPITLVIEEEDVTDTALLARENLRREVIALADFVNHEELPYLLDRLVTEHQPEAIDWLLAMANDEDATIARRAALVASRFLDRMTSDQVERFIASQMTFQFHLREQYPHGVAAAIPVEARYAPGRDGLPPLKKYVLRTTTQVLLDGKQLGEPIESDSSARPTSWSMDDPTWDIVGRTKTQIPTQSLDAGEHTLKLATQFTLTRDGRSFDGQVESDERSFRIVESTVDGLAAPVDSGLQKRVVDSLDIVESAWTWIPKAWRNENRFREAWSPQEFRVDGETGMGLHGPAWRPLKPLPVDLCFDVELHIEKTGDVLNGKPLIAIRGQRRGGYIGLGRVDPRMEAAADESGFVRARIILKPSREVALSNPEVTSYFQGTVTSKPVRLLVWRSQQMQEAELGSLPVPDPERNETGVD